MSGYQDRNGVWRTDERSLTEQREDVIGCFAVVLLGLVLVIAAVLVAVL